MLWTNWIYYIIFFFAVAVFLVAATTMLLGKSKPEMTVATLFLPKMKGMEQTRKKGDIPQMAMKAILFIVVLAAALALWATFTGNWGAVASWWRGLLLDILPI